MDKTIRLGIIFLILVFIGIATSTIYHERAHVVIFEEYGMENITVDYGITSTTSAYGYCNDDCRMLNKMNEVVGYNLQGIEAMIIIALGFIFFMYIEMGAFDD